VNVVPLGGPAATRGENAVRHYFPLIVLLACISAAGCKRGTARQDDSKTAFENSPCRTEYKASRFGSAAKACEDQMKAPGQPGARAFASLAHFQLGEYSRAADIAQEGAATTPGEKGALFVSLQGLAVLGSGDTTSALQLMDAAVRQAPQSTAHVYLSRAKARFIAGTFDAALEDVVHAQSVDRASAAPELMLGYLMLRDGPNRRKDAVTHFARASSLEPSNARAIVCRFVTTTEPIVVPAATDSSWDQQLLDLARRGATAKDDLLMRAAATDGKHASAERRVEVHLLLGTLAETQGDLARARVEYEAALATPVHTMDSVLARARLRAIGPS